MRIEARYKRLQGCGYARRSLATQMEEKSWKKTVGFVP
jgi:hypothetical protein